MGIPLNAQVGKLEIFRLFFMPSFLLSCGWIFLFGGDSRVEHSVELLFAGVAMWVFSLWPIILLLRAVLERIQGQSRVSINAAGITFQTRNKQFIAWNMLDSIEVQNRRTMSYAGSRNFIINLLRRNYKVYSLKLNEAGNALTLSDAPLEIVPIELSVSEEQVETVLTSWLVVQS